VALIQALIPLGLQAVGEALDAEVTALAGTRYCQTGGQAGVVRWGQQRGSVYLADQKLAIPVPRVRDRAANREVALSFSPPILFHSIGGSGQGCLLLRATFSPAQPRARRDALLSQASTVSSCAFCEQGRHLGAPSSCFMTLRRTPGVG
jgi:hypothetical protein